MFKIFILLASVANVNPSDSYVIDYHLTESDCAAVMLDVSQSDGFEIEPGIVVAVENLILECQVENELPPCEFEDSSNCFWDAATRGNGQGESFFDVDGEIFYLN